MRRALWLIRAIDLATLRAAWWAASQLRPLRKDLRADGLAVEVPPPPRLPQHAVRGVTGFSAVAHATCLERSFLLQRWLAEHDRPHSIAVGVAGPSDSEFRAHAWVVGFDPDPDAYTVLTSVSAPEPVRTGWPGHGLR
jgi:hypothetical protein